MSTTRPHLRRRLLSVVTAGALSAATLSFAAPAQAADVPGQATGSGPTAVSDATFTWGLSGYAQKGIFGAWTFKDLSGNVTQLDGATQTEYETAPVPATSFPVGAAKPKANAVKFTEGTGVIDESTGAGKLSWTGKYVVNAYPATFNAPNETYEDPQLTVAANGSGTLTVDFSIGAGTDMEGNPFDAQDFGRVKLATFDAGSLTAKSDTGYRVTPDYQGVENGLSNQAKTCSDDGDATGWWGSWPQEFIDALNSHASGQSVLPHFYSTGCSGMQDLKPPLPLDVTFHAADAPKVTVSNTALNASGTSTVTVTGQNFDPALATGTRPPLSGKSAGSYIAFGKFASNWRPSLSAPSSSRKTGASGTAVKWAVLGEFIPTPITVEAGGVELSPTGSFTAQVEVDKAALDALATDPALTNYGIYTYPGSGGTAPAYETYVPLTFSTPVVKRTTTTSLSWGTKPTSKKAGSIKVTVNPKPAGATPTGKVTLKLIKGSKTYTRGSKTLSGAKATVAVPKLAKGTWKVRLVYSPTGNFVSSYRDTTLTVKK